MATVTNPSQPLSYGPVQSFIDWIAGVDNSPEASDASCFMASGGGTASYNQALYDKCKGQMVSDITSYSQMFPSDFEAYQNPVSMSAIPGWIWLAGLGIVGLVLVKR